jgi:DnaK suppressor protein
MDLNTQKETLNNQVLSLQERIKSNQEIASQKREGSSEDDIASLYEMQATAHSAIHQDKNLLRKSFAAIRRIESDDYEYCNGCGDEINPKRLIANPVAVNCIDCANIEFEKSKHNSK